MVRKLIIVSLFFLITCSTLRINKTTDDATKFKLNNGINVIFQRKQKFPGCIF